MKLLVLAEDFYPNVSGGANTRWRFSELAVERGHEVTVFTPLRDGTPRHEVVNGVEIRRPFPAKPTTLPAYSTLSLVTRAIYSILLFCYLLVWLHGREFGGIHSASASMHWVSSVLAAVYRLPTVTFVGYTPSAGGNWEWTPQFVRERINFRFFMGDVVFSRTARARVVLEEVSGCDVALIDGILHEPKLRETVADVDHAEKRASLGVEEDQKLIAFVGRLVPVKNPRGAVDVVASLSAEYRLAVVGDGPAMESMRARAVEHGVVDRVEFCGEVEHTDALEIISAADALLVTSCVESYAAVVFEALALDTPVVSTPVANLEVEDHPDLHLAPVEEQAGVVRNLDLDVGDNGELDEAVLERYSMERYTDQILGAFDRLSGRGVDTMGSN